MSTKSAEVIEHSIAKRPDVPTVTVNNDANSIMAVIAKAAADPTVNVEKLEKLTGLYERITANSAKAAYDAALAAMQPTLPTVDRRGKIIIRDKNNDTVIKQSTPYALFEDINEAIRPVLAAHGFAVSFRTGIAGDGKITVTGILSHKDGHREETTITLPHDSTGSKNSVQAVGSSTSYGKRYVMCALLNITTRGEDDDGKKAGDDQPISDEQADKIKALVAETKSDITLFLKWIGAESVSDIPAGKYERAIERLEAKKVRA